MGNLLETGIGVLERLFAVVNTPKKLLMLIALMSLGGSGFLGWYLIQNQGFMDDIVSPRIERVGTAMSGGAMCYQQRHKERNGTKDARIIGIQFPVSDHLAKRGVEQNLAGFTVKKEPSLEEFNDLCNLLVQEISSPERQKFLWQAYPEYRQKLLDFYNKMNTQENPPVLKLRGKTPQPAPRETAANKSIVRG